VTAANSGTGKSCELLFTDYENANVETFEEIHLLALLIARRRTWSSVVVATLVLVSCIGLRAYRKLLSLEQAFLLTKSRAPDGGECCFTKKWITAGRSMKCDNERGWLG
jgi:hypothetical protein